MNQIIIAVAIFAAGVAVGRASVDVGPFKRVGARLG